ncbi:MAG: hypothetical protein MUF00_00510 [Gemmatimonadaceae bacterium]|jgi:hypothetical protein|nr:hypothetical protein [Gemmatimonadaceae bacterium]
MPTPRAIVRGRLLVGMALAILWTCASPPTVEVPPLFRLPPVRHVNVYAYPNLLAVDRLDTLEANGFDSTGVGVWVSGAATWRVSDSTRLSMRELDPRRRQVEVRALRPGLVEVVATIAGVSGRDTVRIIPALLPLELTPAAVSLRRGDSTFVRLRIRTTDGVAVRGLFVSWWDTTYRATTWPHFSDSVWVRALERASPGVGALRASVAGASVTLPVTVTP